MCLGRAFRPRAEPLDSASLVDWFFGRLAGAPGSLCAVPVARQYYAQVVCVALRLAVAAWGAYAAGKIPTGLTSAGARRPARPRE